MAASWLLHAIYASLLGQSAIPRDNSTAGSSAVFVTTTTAYGDLKGVRKPTASNVLIDLYLGIPYASPPVGQGRFSKPEPPVKWSGVRDASKFGNECHQKFIPRYKLKVGDKPVEQSEDCLYLNVYVPANHDAKTDQPLAVMVWIHGGGFFAGAGSQFDGTELAATGVILVTINYRLDVFGFLSNEDDVLPGNYGMLDQVMALKWVNQNIGFFGGDQNRVTIFGQSAGSASVSLLVLSPLAKGLFNRAIMESGGSLAPWAVATQSRKVAPSTLLSLVANDVGCSQYDISNRLECLRNVDAQVLINASTTVRNLFSSAYILYSPRVEKTFSFLPDLPITLLSQNKFSHVETIHGFNAVESGPESSNIDPEADGVSKDEFASFVDSRLEPYISLNRDTFLKDIMTSYIGSQTDRNATRNAATRAISDFFFNGPTIVEANIVSGLAPEKKHYLYEFNYKPSTSFYPSWMNTTHGEELQFVFGVNLPVFVKFYGKTPNKEDNVISNQMKLLWTNFAKFGDPTKSSIPGIVKWTTYDERNRMCLKIDTASQVLPYSNTRGTTIFEKALSTIQTSYTIGAIVG